MIPLTNERAERRRVKRFRDAHWWLVLGPLLLAQAVMLGLWVWGGWTLGRALAGSPSAVGAPALLGAALGAGAWWAIGTALDWLGYRMTYHVTRGRWEFQPLAGAVAGWTLPVVVLAGLALAGALCWGLATALGGLH